MREFLISFGKTIYALGWFSTTNGQQPQDFQYFGIGLYFFVWGCVCFAVLSIIGLVSLIKYIRKRLYEKNKC